MRVMLVTGGESDCAAGGCCVCVGCVRIKKALVITRAKDLDGWGKWR